MDEWEGGFQMKKNVSPATAAIIIVIVVVIVALIGWSFVKKKGGQAAPQLTPADIQSNMQAGMKQKTPGGGPDSPDAQIK